MAVQSWITGHGMQVERVAHNQLLLEYSGTVAQWNAAFGATLHVVQRNVTSVHDNAYAPVAAMDVPAPLAGKIKRLLMPDAALPSGTLAKDSAPILKTPPPSNQDYSPSEIAGAYGLSDLYAQGFRGAGMTLGVVGGTTFRLSDAQSMWQAFGIQRTSPVTRDTMEPQQTRASEASMDVQLAGAVAPAANLIYYGGPDTSETSLVYTLNEAVGLNEAQVLSYSFSHSESDTPKSVSVINNETALVAASLGISLVAAAGDSIQVDTPSNSPYVTAVGGTNVYIDDTGVWVDEESWPAGGCGASRWFALPAYQAGLGSSGGTQRLVADVSVNTGYYWVKYLGNWVNGDGTSAATPVFAAILTVLNQYRQAQGKPQLGFLNPIIYQVPSARAAFRYITVMNSGGCTVRTGYDQATGLGSPLAMAMATGIP
jgi:kumamolisin